MTAFETSRDTYSINSRMNSFIISQLASPMEEEESSTRTRSITANGGHAPAKRVMNTLAIAKSYQNGPLWNDSVNVKQIVVRFSVGGELVVV